MLVCAQCTQAAFSDCYGECVEGCPIFGKRRARCIADCIFNCKAKPANSCNVDCTTNRCTGFGKGYAHAASVCYNNCKAGCQSLPPDLQQRAKCILNCVFKCAGKPVNSCNLKCTSTGFGNGNLTLLPLLRALV
ncbi:hypothetical protein SASPL_118857 [Salvia splendens]|uniref:Uncharacterized protein n=1 Tax=Salvia splendens TaxID=180675 RepID=A0A8X8ZZI2_SALSN|nr:hypothetical protein SASPL_118857 [Salvia splendens]